MPKPPISFRLSEDEYSLLEKNRLDNESLNQCAVRLLREKLGVFPEPTNNLTEENVKKMIQEETEKLNTDILTHIDNRVDSLETRIKVLETKPKRTTVKTKPIPEI